MTNNGTTTVIGADGTVWVWDDRTQTWVVQTGAKGWDRAYMER